jgi:predicted PurR-regulated permease PerM
MCKKVVFVFFILFTFIPAAYLYALTPDQERQLFQTLGEIKGELRQINKRIEEVNTSLSKRIDDTNRRIEEVNRSLNERIDKLIDIMIGITATFAGLVGVMMGLVFWDRKTLITKAKEETIKEIEKEGRLKDLIRALRKLAKTDHQIAEVLQQFNLL